MSAGKGDTPRPVDPTIYGSNYNDIFRKDECQNKPKTTGSDSFRLSYETYQRIQRLAKREGTTISKALERLVRTEESERIEPTIPVDYSKIHHRERGYTVTKILDKHFK